MKRSLRKLERKINMSPSHKSKFLIARKAYKHELNLHKTSYYESKFNACGNDTRKIFKMANSILGTNIKSKSTALPDAALCSSFVSSLSTKLSHIFDNISSKLAQLPMTLYAHITTNPISCKLSCFTPPSITEIRNLILTANSTSPIDPLPLVVFKNIVPISENAILYLISQSLDDGIMVSSLKYAIIKPILKKPYLDPDVLTNYRPISQLPILSKIMERVVSRQLINYLENNNLLDYFQSAYRKSFSTETALTHVTDLIHNSLDSSHCVQLLLIDLSSAFDMLNHSILINRIIELGIEGSPLKWLMSFITDRTSSVKINDFISPPTNILKGVPQGSVLGPLLFSIYLRPISNIIRKYPNIYYHIYADDIQLLLKLPIDSMNSNSELSDCTSEITYWLLTNDLLVNTSKTELLNISKVPVTFPTLSIDGIIIKPSESVRNLGVLIDSTLSYGAHINAISKSANLYLRKIRHIRNYCSPNITKRLLNALVLSRIDYCCSLFYGIKNSEVIKIDRIIRSSVRLVHRLKRRDHALTDTHQCNMKWLSFRKRCQFRLLCLTHKTLFLGRPAYLRALLTRRNILPHLRSSDATLLDLPVTRNVMRSRSFTSMAPTTWNLLPYRLRRLKSPHVFANSLKDYLNLKLK